MNDKQQKIMERINNLLSKTVENGCTPQEAAAAAAMAQRLIAKHHVDMREYNESEEVGTDKDTVQKPWQAILAHVIAKNTCCKVIRTVRGRGKATLTFIGRETDRTVVLQMFDRLMWACARGISEQRKKYRDMYGTTKGVENSYAMGFIDAVEQAMGEQCRALMLVVPEDVKEKTHELFPCLKKGAGIRATVSGAYSAGVRDGRSAAGRKSIAE